MVMVVILVVVMVVVVVVVLVVVMVSMVMVMTNGQCDKVNIITLDPFYCSDVDECVVNNGGCSQICHNTLGGYNCACRHGYTLLPNGRTCKGMTSITVTI